MTKLFRGLESYDGEMIYQVFLEDINPRSKERIRKLKERYKDDPDYISLREDMRAQGQINPIQLDTNLKLVAGFRRYLVAMELNWKTIGATIKEYTEEERLDTELSENLNRKNFTDYETYIGLAKRKRLYEEKHPETARGKYDRNNINETIINETVSFLDQRSESFTEHYARRYGYNRRTLEYKIQIGEAILNNEFHPKTIREIEGGKLTQKQILSKLRQRTLSKLGKSKLQGVFNLKPKTSEESSGFTRVKKNDGLSYDKEPDTFQKIETIIDLRERDPEIKNQWDDVKKGKRSVNDAFRHTKKILETKTNIIEEIKNKHLNAGSQISVKEKKNVPKDKNNEISEETTLVNSKKCKTCSKANNIAILCDNCGFPTPKVICDYDLIKGEAKLRDPEKKRCSRSPKLELINHL